MYRLSWLGLLVLCSVGSLVAQPIIHFWPTSLDFGEVAVGSVVGRWCGL